MRYPIFLSLMVAVAVASGCSEGSGRPPEDLARLPVEEKAANEGGRDQCERELPEPDANAVPPAQTPFLDRTIWFDRDEVLGNQVLLAVAPASSPEKAADEFVDQLTKAGFRVEGNNADGDRAAVTFSGSGFPRVQVVITHYCDGFVELAYHFTGGAKSTPS